MRERFTDELPPRRPLTEAEKVLVLERFGHACAGCGGGGPFEFDHIRPRWLDGTDDVDNFQPLCVPNGCHTRKSASETKIRSKIKRIRKKGRDRRSARDRAADKARDKYRESYTVVSEIVE